MAEEKKSESIEFDQMMDADVPQTSDAWMNATQKLRFGLIKKHLKDSDDPKMLARIDSLAAGIDRQELTKKRMEQDKEEGAANREIAQEVFANMVKAGYTPQTQTPQEPEIESSGMELLDDELIQGDDTLDSVIN